MTNYFIGRVAVDGKPAMDFKNMNSHAFPLYKAGHIQSVLVQHENTKTNIRCTCLPEMKKNILYKIDMSLDESGDITRASCACPAGAGPFGSCKHICALSYALEEFSRIKQVRPPHSCTSQLQQWNQPRKRKLDACDVEDIMFIKHVYGKSKRQPSSTVYDPRPLEMASTSQEVALLAERLRATNEDVAMLHLLLLLKVHRKISHPYRHLNESSSLMNLHPSSNQFTTTAGLKFVEKLT